jgi:hypothetical protein
MDINFVVCSKCGKHGRLSGPELTSPEAVIKDIGYQIIFAAFELGAISEDDIASLYDQVKNSTIAESIATAGDQIMAEMILWNAKLHKEPELVDVLQTECLSDLVTISPSEAKEIVRNAWKAKYAHKN